MRAGNKRSFYMNSFEGKVIVFDGDSICHGGSRYPERERGWSARVGNSLGMEWYNYARGGGTVTAEMYAESTGEARHWISRYVDVIREKHPTLDYLILEGGVNDADLLEKLPERYGSLDISDYSGNYDDTTFTGALESLFYKAINYYPKAKIGFIIGHKMGCSKIGFGAENNRRRYFLRVIEVCKKWGIPYIDLWESSPVNPLLPCYYDSSLDVDGNLAAGYAYSDGQHLTAVGYDIVSSAIRAWVCSL